MIVDNESDEGTIPLSFVYVRERELLMKPLTELQEKELRYFVEVGEDVTESPDIVDELMEMGLLELLGYGESGDTFQATDAGIAWIRGLS